MRKQRPRGKVNYLAQSQILKFQMPFRDSIFYQAGDREVSPRGPEQAAAAELRVAVSRLWPLSSPTGGEEGRVDLRTGRGSQVDLAVLLQP